jgi:hypothetical protein
MTLTPDQNMPDTTFDTTHSFLEKRKLKKLLVLLVHPAGLEPATF